MSVFILVVVVFLQDAPVDGGMRVYPDLESCKEARVNVVGNSKDKAVGFGVYVSECTPVKSPPAIKAPPPPPQKGSNS